MTTEHTGDGFPCGFSSKSAYRNWPVMAAGVPGKRYLEMKYVTGHRSVNSTRVAEDLKFESKHHSEFRLLREI